MSFEKEQAWYKANQEKLFSEHPGKWVAVDGDQFIGTFKTLEAAYVKAVEKTRREKVFVRQIMPDARVLAAPALTTGFINAPLYV